MIKYGEKMSTRSEIIRLLKEDEEFRYMVAGLLGLEDLRSSMKKLLDAITSLSEKTSRLEEAYMDLAKKMGKLGERIVGIEGRMDGLDGRMIRLEERVSGLENISVKLAERIDGLEKSHVNLIEKMSDLEEVTARLVEGVSRLNIEVGKLSESIGFSLEDIARVVVPGWLHRHEGILVENIVRKFFYIDGEEVEINLYGEGLKNGDKVIVLGEAKSRIYGDDVKRFYASVKKIMKVIKEKICLVMFAFYAHPSAEDEAKARGIITIASYMR